jgi:hypothetical protein
VVDPRLAGVAQQVVAVCVEPCLGGGIETGAGPGQHVDVATGDLSIGQRLTEPLEPAVSRPATSRTGPTVQRVVPEVFTA